MSILLYVTLNIIQKNPELAVCYLVILGLQAKEYYRICIYSHHAMEKQMYRPHWLVDLIFLLKDKISKINMTNI